MEITVDNFNTFEIGFKRIQEELKKRDYGNLSQKKAGRRKLLLIENRESGKMISLIIKTRKSGDWQPSITDGKKIDKPPKIETMFWIFVDISKSEKYPAFCIAPDWWVSKYIYDTHQKYINKYGGRRKKSPNSKHFKIQLKSVESWRNRWDLLAEALNDDISPYDARSQKKKHEDDNQIGAGFGDSTQNKEIELLAMNSVAQKYKSLGWKVKDVSLRKIGFDLLCTKGEQKKHIEVKGIRGKMQSFIITKNELDCAQNDKNFSISLVTSVLEKPKVIEYSAKDLLTNFDLQPILFNANKKG